LDGGAGIVGEECHSGASRGVSGGSSIEHSAVVMAAPPAFLPACRVDDPDCYELNRDGTMWSHMASRNRVELKWRRLRTPFAFFLWPDRLLGLQDSGFIEGKALIREKEFVENSPFPKNKIMSIVARLPASLRRGLEKTRGSNCVWIKYYGYRQWKGQGPLRARFFVQGVTPKREKEILEDECKIPRNQWP